MWTITATIDESGRYGHAAVTFDEPRDVEEEEEEVYRSQATTSRGLGAVDPAPYNANLVYRNGHIQSTPGIVGAAGGP